MRDIHFFDDGFNGVQGRHTLMSKRSMQSVEHESCQAFEDGQLTEIKGFYLEAVRWTAGARPGCRILQRWVFGKPNGLGQRGEVMREHVKGIIGSGGCRQYHSHRTVGGGLPAVNDDAFVLISASTASRASPLPQASVCCATALRRRRGVASHRKPGFFRGRVRKGGWFDATAAYTGFPVIARTKRCD